MKLKIKFKWLASKITIKKLAIVIVAGALVIVFKSNIIQDKFFSSKGVIKQNTYSVKKGTLNSLVAGSGAIYSTNSSKVYSKIGALVKNVNYKEGDLVKAGDVIYELDNTDAQNTVDTSLNKYKQNQLSAMTNNDAVNNLSIKAPFTGLVSNIIVNQGDTVSKDGTVFTITDTSKLKVILTYNAADIGEVTLGQSAEVHLTSLMQSIEGIVTYISNQSVTTATGGQVGTVEIQVNNPGAILGGMTASADIKTSKGTISSTKDAALNYINKQTVTSLTGGTVVSVSVKENQKVNLGQNLITMKNDDIIRTKQNSDLQLENAQEQMDLNTKQLDNYKIISPVDGVITTISNKVGDTVTAGAELVDVLDPKQMEFDVTLDELDIAKIKVGQKVNITIDALAATSKTPIDGQVEKIGVTGTTTSGVTTFTVTVKINDSLDKIKAGMNASAEIVVLNKENILSVPLEAVNTINGKYYIMLKGSGTNSNQTGMPPMGAVSLAATTTKSTGNSKSEATVSTVFVETKNTENMPPTGMPQGNRNSSSKIKGYYDGAVSTEVKIGSSNDTSVEIASGLKDGDVVILPQTKASSSTTSTKDTGGPPDGGGGPPG